MSAAEWQVLPSPAARPLRFVIADDSAVMRILVRSLLESQELEVAGEAEDGITALALALDAGADVALLDVDLPRLSGFGAAEIIRSQQPGTRVLLHAERPSQAMHRRARALGLSLVDRLELPEAILALVERVPDRRRSRQNGSRRGRVLVPVPETRAAER